MLLRRNLLALQRPYTICAQRIRYLSTRPPASDPPPRRGPDLSKVNRLKESFDYWNQNSKHKKKVAAGLIALYIITAVAGIQYLRDTKHKATGDPSPYQPLMDDGEEHSGIPSPRDTTEVYDSLAADYDSKIWWEELLSYIWLKRRKVMKNVEGDVLEVACGTGRNLPYFRPDSVKSITFLDSSLAMLEITRQKFEKKFKDYTNVQYVKGRAEDLEKLVASSGQKFDTIYETFGLCSQQDPDAVLKSFKSLLRPNGRVVLLEHGRSDKDSLNERMDKKAEARAKEWGCRWNLDIHRIIETSGFEIVEQDRYHFGTTYYYVLKLKSAEENKLEC